jgi:hypothetical protein
MPRMFRRRVLGGGAAVLALASHTGRTAAGYHRAPLCGGAGQRLFSHAPLDIVQTEDRPASRTLSRHTLR